MADDKFHPCQGMADVMGWAEWYGEGPGRPDFENLKGKKLLLTWASGALARSWCSVQEALLVASRFGMDVTIARPDAMNSFTSELSVDLLAALETAHHEDAVQDTYGQSDSKAYDEGKQNAVTEPHHRPCCQYAAQCNDRCDGKIDSPCQYDHRHSAGQDEKDARLHPYIRPVFQGEEERGQETENDADQYKRRKQAELFIMQYLIHHSSEL